MLNFIFNLHCQSICVCYLFIHLLSKNHFRFKILKETDYKTPQRVQAETPFFYNACQNNKKTESDVKWRGTKTKSNLDNLLFFCDEILIE